MCNEGGKKSVKHSWIHFFFHVRGTDIIMGKCTVGSPKKIKTGVKWFINSLKAAFSIPSTWRTPQPLHVDQTFDTGTDKNWNLVLLTTSRRASRTPSKDGFPAACPPLPPFPHSLNLLLLFGPSSAVTAFTATSPFLFALDFFSYVWTVGESSEETYFKRRKEVVWFRVWLQVVCNAVM